KSRLPAKRRSGPYASSVASISCQRGRFQTFAVGGETVKVIPPGAEGSTAGTSTLYQSTSPSGEIVAWSGAPIVSGVARAGVLFGSEPSAGPSVTCGAGAAPRAAAASTSP